ncbi:transketolase [Desulfobaculum bizertense]|uniref:Transketolase n=1 Tax=Desulfobaculum bizertense DSM 18034 TaxID=1121442 RepID=A0A1T4W6L4_9BACT|nr:transketolase [Desulfobaculum bizertense]UIJ39016.1 transketolase [Desulfobaculum bizertense]SKA72759.1 transketolase [Desulfobaculum bizertense DSM 18034]
MKSQVNPEMDAKAVNVLKALVMDATRKANSGHPGGPMSSADMTYILFKDFLRFDPSNPNWFNRDRFILSAGHESSLLYGLLHFCDYLSVEDLKGFRQFGSRTPGHPEIEIPGVEVTTGPLGQGFAMGVGEAVAEALLRNKLGKDVQDHYSYVLASDGDFQEPIALGAASLAGLWGLGKLIVMYDKNDVQLAGPTSRCDCIDYVKVFEGMCWQVLEINGHNHEEIREAVKKAQLDPRPTLIIGHTVMAKGTATREGDHETHGAPLPPEEIAATKEKWGLDPQADFQVPEDVLVHFRSEFGEYEATAAQWHRQLVQRIESDADFEALWKQVSEPRSGLSFELPEFEDGSSVATRKAWGACLNAITDQLPLLAGGSADLDPSNQTAKFRETVGVFCKDDHSKRNLSFGVREFPMAAILNGMAAHGGVVPFGATFLVFSDYERNALRMSALQKLPVLHVFTHDSFYVGEDGPTHQPIEHASSLRLIPDLNVFRPADAYETRACLEMAIKEDEHPSCLLLTRQGLPVLAPASFPSVVDGPSKGGYILKDAEGEAEITIIASGSEVSLALDTAAQLAPRKVRVVSVPCMDIFDAQSDEYKKSVLGNGLRVAVEAGASGLWYKYTGLDGIVFGLDHFGASAPAGELAKEYGFTPENLTRIITEKLG